jgi:hypothetical protein
VHTQRRGNGLTPARIWQAEDTRFEHARAALQHGLHFPRSDVFATADDEIVNSPEHVKITVCIEASQVSGLKLTLWA